jgi:hypothetical protein
MKVHVWVWVCVGALNMSSMLFIDLSAALQFKQHENSERYSVQSTHQSAAKRALQSLILAPPLEDITIWAVQ